MTPVQQGRLHPAHAPLHQPIENKLVTLIFEMYRIPLSALLFIFGMSDMQSRAARENPNKAETN
jgi:hypothetical protein